MPTYDYICKECGERFEHFQTMSSERLTQRPGCDRGICNVIRLISGGTGLIFKGSGYYQTDYKNKGKDDSSLDGKEKKPKKEKKSPEKKSTDKKVKIK